MFIILALKMKLVFAFAGLFMLAAAKTTTEFEKFKTDFGKSYKSAVDEAFRFKIFQENLRIINDHNVLYSQGKASFDMAINQFSDLTNEEFTERYTGFLPPVNYKAENVFVGDGVSVPTFVDWRNSGCVTEVESQGACGSCWAFSATGALEGQTCIVKGYLIDLSEQNLVDCSRPQGNNGCGGGWMNNAFKYVIQNGGMNAESSYPYEARNGPCRFNPNRVVATARNYVDIQSGNENALKVACADKGPISVAIDSRGDGFQSYGSGVYNNPACSQAVTHAVLVVGYGTQSGNDYWLCKNSWGKYWGEQGYIKMSRNRNNQCAIASYASYPVV